MSIKYRYKVDVYMAYCMPLVIIWSQQFFEAPQVGETRCLAHASRIEARAKVVLGVHRSAFGEQQLRSRDLAVVRRPAQRRLASGGFPPKPVWPLWASGGRRGTEADAPGRTTEVVGMLSSITRSTDKGTMNVLDSTSSKLFTFTNTLDKFQYIFFTTLLLMKKMYIILIAFSMVMRPVRTMSSIRW